MGMQILRICSTEPFVLLIRYKQFVKSWLVTLTNIALSCYYCISQRSLIPYTFNFPCGTGGRRQGKTLCAVWPIHFANHGLIPLIVTVFSLAAQVPSATLRKALF